MQISNCYSKDLESNKVTDVINLQQALSQCQVPKAIKKQYQREAINICEDE